MRLSVAKVFWPKLAKGSKRHGCIHGYRIYIQNKSVLCKDLRLGYSWLDAVSAPVPGVQMLVSWHRDMHSMAEKKNILVNISNSNANSNLLFHTGRRLVHCAISKKTHPHHHEVLWRDESEWGINHNTGSLPAAFDQNWRMSSRTDNRAATAKLRSDYSRDVCISRIIINSAIVLCRQKIQQWFWQPLH